MVVNVIDSGYLSNGGCVNKCAYKYSCTCAWVATKWNYLGF